MILEQLIASPSGVAALLEGFDDEGIRPMMLELIDDAATSLWGVVLALAVAAGIGAMHALGPGHGKLVVGGYLASSEGRTRDAVALGALVGLMHTGSVLALGLVFHASARMPASDRIDAVLSVVTGAAVVAVGAVLLRRQIRLRRCRPVTARVGKPGPRDLAHPEDDHGDGGLHAHDHHHEPPPGVAPMSRAGVTALAASGGLLPSPAAFAVLVTALAIGRTGYGLALVVAFGTGLAVTLTTVGLVVVRGRDGLTRRARARTGGARLVATVPLVGSMVVLGGGLVMVASAVMRW